MREKAHKRNWKLGKSRRDLDYHTGVTQRGSKDGGHVAFKDSSASVGGSVRLQGDESKADVREFCVS